MKGGKGCLVCGKEHLPNARHMREKVTAAVNMLKVRNPQAILNVDDLAEVVNMADM